MKKIIRFLIFVFIIVLIYVSFSVAPPFVTKTLVRQSHQLTITGHRGAAGLAPENTLPSINEALRLNVDRVEIDVRQTKDGALVLMHDTTIDRTTDGSGYVHDHSLKALKKLDAGSWFSAKYSKTKIPTLKEAIEAVKGKSELLIEIKEGDWMYPGIEQNVVDIIREYDMQDSIIVQSFYDDVLFLIHEIDPDIRLHKLFIADTPFFHYDGDGFRFVKFDRYDIVEEFSILHHFASNRFLKKAKSMGKKVNVWTIRSEDKGEKYIKMNVDGLITDYPNYFTETTN
jgi:glycerophosphoryl diester phosphodiesterase